MSLIVVVMQLKMFRRESKHHLLHTVFVAVTILHVALGLSFKITLPPTVSVGNAGIKY